MSQINFISQFNLIMEFSKRKKLSSYERVFYMSLFHMANRLAQSAENHDWPEDFFPVSNSEISEWTNLDERAIRNTRNSLMQKGIIRFKKGDGKKRDPEYQIFYLSVNGYKIVPTVPEETITACENAADKKTDCKFAPDSVGDTVGDSVGDSAGDTVGGLLLSTSNGYLNININTESNAEAEYRERHARERRTPNAERQRSGISDFAKLPWEVKA